MLPLRDHNKTVNFPFVTIVFILLNVLGFYLEITSLDFENFIYAHALVPAQVNFSEPSTWFPFLTSMFMHGGWLHIISNMWFLWIFGNNVEDVLGKVKYIILYLLSGIAGSLAQFIINPESNIPMLGASGAIAGVLGSYLVMFPRHKIDTLVPFFGFLQVVSIPAMVMIGYWIILQVLSGVGSFGAQGGVAYFAHIGGFVAGWLFTKLFANKSRPQPVELGHGQQDILNP